MNQNALIFLLRNFWRILLSLAGALLGISWAVFGLRKTLVILCLGVLGFYFGKWQDEGRPDGGLFRSLRRFFD